MTPQLKDKELLLKSDDHLNFARFFLKIWYVYIEISLSTTLIYGVFQSSFYSCYEASQNRNKTKEDSYNGKTMRSLDVGCFIKTHISLEVSGSLLF